MMFHKHKASGIVSASSPATVIAELPSLPKVSQPRIRESRDHTLLERMMETAPPPSTRNMEEAPSIPFHRASVAGAAGGGTTDGVPLPAHSSPARIRYVLEFSDGQRACIGARCVAGRMPALPEEGYETSVVLNDPSHQISRHHFEFGITSVGQIWAMDLDSMNGTWLDSHGTSNQLPPSARAVLTPGDVLRFGGMRARLVRVD